MSPEQAAEAIVAKAYQMTEAVKSESGMVEIYRYIVDLGMAVNDHAIAVQQNKEAA